MQNKNTFFFYILLILTCYPLLYSGFVHHDTMYAAIRLWSEDSYLNWLHSVSQVQGRFYMYVQGLLYTIPYLFKNFYYYKIITIGSICFSVVLFYHVIRTLTFSKTFANMSMLCLLISFQISTNHSPLSGYCFFHFGIIFELLSFLYFQNYLICRKPSYLVMSILLFTVTIFVHETMILYVLFIILIAYCHSLYHKKPLQWIEYIKAVSPFIIVIVIYTVAYFVYMFFYPPQYPGCQLDSQTWSLINYFKSLWQYTISAFPSYLFFDKKYADFFNYYSNNTYGHENILWSLIASMKVEWIIRASISVYLSYHIMSNGNIISGNRKYLLLGITSLLLLFIPNSLICVSNVYQNYASQYERISTHMTYFSIFGVAVLMATIAFIGLDVIEKYKAMLLKTFWICFVSLIVALFSLCTDYSNSYVAHSQYLLREKWSSLNLFYQTKLFQNIPENSLVYSPSLWHSNFSVYFRQVNYSGSHHALEQVNKIQNYWEKYTYAMTGKRIQLTNDINKVINANSGTDIYYLAYMQEDKDSKQYITFGKLTAYDDRMGRFFTDDMALCSYAKNKRFNISFRTKNKIANVKYDENTIFAINDDQVNLIIDKRDIKKPMLITRFQAQNIDMDSVLISYYTNKQNCYDSLKYLPVFNADSIIEAEKCYISHANFVVGSSKVSGGSIESGEIACMVNIQKFGKYKVGMKIKYKTPLCYFRRIHMRVDEHSYEWQFDPQFNQWDWIDTNFSLCLKPGNHIFILSQVGCCGEELDIAIDQLKVYSITESFSNPLNDYTSTEWWKKKVNVINTNEKAPDGSQDAACLSFDKGIPAPSEIFRRYCMDIVPGDQINASIWLWTLDKNISIHLSLARHGDTKYEGSTMDILLNETPRRFTISHKFLQKNTCVRLHLQSSSQVPFKIFAFNPKLSILKAKQ
ncbi:conserved hypothetical protein, membrane [Candidatus Magnetomorum sp. HK-1]|nr:conserved hypothetical protein, membrane [Candidatus Magnetomorum sp. HK-1]